MSTNECALPSQRVERFSQLAADEELVGLALSGVLGDNHPRNALEQFTYPRVSGGAKLGSANASSGSTRCYANEVIDSAQNLDSIEGSDPARHCVTHGSRWRR